MWFGANLDPSLEDPYYFFETNILNAIERVDGVASIDYGGVEPNSIQIELDSEKLRSHKISVYELVQKLRTANFTMAGGEITEREGSYLSDLLASSRVWKKSRM